MDGIAWETLIWGDTVYVGGSFTKARPAGSALGVNEVPRANVLAFDLATGVLKESFVADTNAQVLAMEMAPDGSKLYIGGDFTTVNGSAAYRIAAVDPTTGELQRSFRASASYRVQALVVTDSTVYAGGLFNSAGSGGGQPRSELAAFARTDGALLQWAPVAEGGGVLGMAHIPGSDRIVVAGAFSKLNGVTALGSGALNLVTGDTLSFPLNQVVQNSGSSAAVYSLHASGNRFYGTGYTFGPGGNFEGNFATDAQGNIVWLNDIWGDQYDIAVSRGLAFAVGHMHNDANLEGGVPEQSPRKHWHSLVQTDQATGTLQPSNFKTVSSQSFAGRPAPTLLHWWPEWTTGNVTEAHMAGWTISASDNYVVIGGEFPKIGTLQQQGIVRFTYRDVRQSTDGPRLAGSAFVPDVTSPAAGTAQISIPANWDRDDAVLTYQFQREGKGTIATYTAKSHQMIRPVLTYLETGLEPGTYRYRVRAIDSANRIATGGYVSVTVGGGSALSPYAETVLKDWPNNYYRLGDTGTTMVDSAYTNDGTGSSNIGRGTAGAIVGDGDSAYSFSGGQTAAPSVSATTPRELTTEAWFRTTSDRGGAIVGWGSAATGSSSRVNYVTFMDREGKVRFGVRDFNYNVLASPLTYNDGKWHHVVSTLSWATGQQLWIDGKLVASNPNVKHGRDSQGFWRIGGDNLSGWPGRGWSDYLNGSIDEVATYRHALPQESIELHHGVGTGTRGVPNTSPSAAFSASASDLSVSVDAAASTDPDGSIAAYEWDFGDGSSATGITASHPYAAPGTYTVRLTVRDNRGATGVSAQQVTVTEPISVPGAFLADGFSRTSASGWGTASTGGAWAVSSSTNFSVNGSAGLLRLAGPGAKNRATSPVSAQDVDVTAVVGTDKLASGGSTAVSLGVRSNGTSAYVGRLRFETNGTLSLHLLRSVNGAQTTVAGGTVPGTTYAAGQQFNVRLQAVGSGTSTLRAKVWPVGSAEPTSWNTTFSDATAALQVPGAVYLEGYLATSATSAPVFLTVDQVVGVPAA